MTARRTPLVLAIACLALAAAGCEKEVVVHEAHTEGIYLDVGPLDYQVQLSRVLNPSEIPDRDYFAGIPEGALDIPRGEAWFAVFIRVQNQTEESHPSAEEFEIVDTQENVYRPIEIDTADNAVAYEARDLAPGDILPATDSVGADGPTQGEMLLFKLPFSTLQNRPLEFKIVGPDGGEEEAVVDLDV